MPWYSIAALDELSYSLYPYILINKQSRSFEKLPYELILTRNFYILQYNDPFIY